MKIGLISDTHDNLPLIRKAVQFFNKNKVDLVLHAGDYVAPFSLAPLRNLNVDWQGVFGNNDGDKKLLAEKSSNKIKEPPLFLELNSRKIAVVHDFRKLGADVIVFGHTHKPHIEKTGNILLVNPGEAGSWLSGRSSVAILNVDNLSANIFYI